MTTDCDVIRDLLPLYADDVCSDASRRIIEEHLLECPECAAMLGQLRTREIEDNLRSETVEVIANQELRFKRRSAQVGSVIAGIFMIPILVCLIVNLALGATLSWFFIVLGGLAVAASLIIVPLMVPKDKPFWTLCAFCVSLIALLAICCAVTHGNWFFTAASASLFGLSVIFLPFVLRAEPVKQRIGSFSHVLIYGAVNIILFANMMNMITLYTKSPFSTAVMALLCIAGLALLIYAIKTKREEQ
ncbi:MAG: zf-HC2 domain-containing protein [Coriobacteriales bacterium]|nr:zf-HC2 domain-containing protein [Coriobacteriales bacterium]